LTALVKMSSHLLHYYSLALKSIGILQATFSSKLVKMGFHISAEK